MFQKSHRAQQKIEPRQSEKQATRRFQIVKLEERIAPNKGGVPNGGAGQGGGYGYGGCHGNGGHNCY